VLAFLARIFALGVQDRVIRLEERLRWRKTAIRRFEAAHRRIQIDQLFPCVSQVTGTFRARKDSAKMEK